MLETVMYSFTGASTLSLRVPERARAAADVEVCSTSGGPEFAAALENLDLALALATSDISDSLRTSAN